MNDMTANLLDSNLDDLPDLPEFVVPPAGAYNTTILDITEKKIGEHPAVEVKFRFDATIELANPSDEAIKDGTECSVAYMLDNEFGVGGLKALLKPLGAALGTATSRATMEGAKGMQVMVVTKVRNGKKGTDKEDQRYLSIAKLEVM